jgi:hypothetical protein
MTRLLENRTKENREHIYGTVGGLAAGVEDFRLGLRSLLNKLGRPAVAVDTTGIDVPAASDVELVVCDRLLWLASRNCLPCAKWGCRKATLWSSVMPWACFLARP